MPPTVGCVTALKDVGESVPASRPTPASEIETARWTACWLAVPTMACLHSATSATTMKLPPSLLSYVVRSTTTTVQQLRRKWRNGGETFGRSASDQENRPQQAGDPF